MILLSITPVNTCVAQRRELFASKPLGVRAARRRVAAGPVARAEPQRVEVGVRGRVALVVAPAVHAAEDHLAGAR